MAVAVRTRPARLEDAEAIAQLTTQLGYPVEAPEQARRLADVLADPEDHLVLVAVGDDDRAVAWIHLERLRYLEGPPAVQINGLVVDERHRSGGIGAQLLEAAEAWGRSRGCELITVRSRMARERAHRFYERAGYEHHKTSKVFRKPL